MLGRPALAVPLAGGSGRFKGSMQKEWLRSTERMLFGVTYKFRSNDMIIHVSWVFHCVLYAERKVIKHFAMAKHMYSGASDNIHAQHRWLPMVTRQTQVTLVDVTLHTRPAQALVVYMFMGLALTSFESWPVKKTKERGHSDVHVSMVSAPLLSKQMSILWPNTWKKTGKTI